MHKIIVSVVLLMLIIVIGFNAFGIAYSPNNFVGTILTVEGWLGDTSGFLLNTRDNITNFLDEWIPKIKEAFKPITDVLDALKDAFEKLDSKFAILDTLSTWLEDAFVKIADFLDYTNVFIRYVIDFGFNFTESEWQDGLTIAFTGLDQGFYHDENGVFDKKSVKKFVDAVLNGADNEFSYFVHNGTIQNITKRTDANAYSIIFYKTSNRDDVPDVEYWLNTVNLTVPADYMNFIKDDTIRTSAFISYYYLPVGAANFSYLDADQGLIYQLTGLRFIPIERNVFTAAVDTLFYGLYGTNTIKINGKWYSLEFEFSYVFTDDTTGEEIRYNSIWIPATEYFLDEYYHAEILYFPYG